MKRNIQIIYLILCCGWLSAMGQNNDTEQVAGRISYKSAQNTYVSFTSTSGIVIGDTLYTFSDNKKVPILLVKQMSSISCVTQAIGEPEPNVNDIVYAFVTLKEPTEKEVVKEEKQEPETIKEKAARPRKEKESFYGRVSVASYSNFSNTDYDNNQRMRYTLSLQGDHIGGSKFSAESYVIFSHKSGEWNEIQSNIFNGLKIYSLALKYEFTDKTNLWFGRKINPLISNLGAIDGLQAQSSLKNFTIGIIGGTRPDYSDYSINTNLLQFGAFAAHNYEGNNGRAQSSLAVVEQMNGSKTDRRFAYFQHSNSMIKNVHLFGSCELDLYKVENDNPQSTLDLTGLYVSARYRPWRQFSVFTSYDARKNVVYYETFKNLADQILENETRQGYRLRFNLRPFKYLNMSVNGGYRYRKGDLSETRNASSYISYSRIPWIDAGLSITGTYLETSYLKGIQYGGNITKDFLQGMLMGTLNYRHVDYNFINSPTGMIQNIGELSLSWRVMKKFSLTMNYEATLEKSSLNNRLYFGLVKRF